MKKDLRPLLSVLFVLLVNTRAGSRPMAEAGAASAIAGPVPIWIGPSADAGRADGGSCPLLRTSFRLAEKPRQATVRIVGLGHYELRLNGRRVGDGVINQAWSAYDKTLFTQEFNIADLLKAGENVFGVRLGNSFWRIGPSNDPGRYRGYATDFSKGQPFLLWMDARIKTPSGAEVSVVSDSGWKWAAGPLVFSDVYGGEDYDARREPAGWDGPSFDDGAWPQVRACVPPAAELAPLPGPPMKEFDVFAPEKIRGLGPAGYVYTFPQNCSALLRFTVSGKTGCRVRFKPAEDLDAAGRVRFSYTWDTGQEVWHDYALRGGGQESHQVLFCYVGCRYVGVTGAVPAGAPNPEGLPVIHKLELAHVRAANPSVGTFACSSGLQNAIERLSDWAIRSNMGPYATDCPHREKYAWLEETWHMAASLSYLYDIRDWYRRIGRNIRDAQLPDGHIPTKAPNYLTGSSMHGFWNEAPEWGIAGVLDPWHLYEWYADKDALAAAFESMKRYVDYLSSRAQEGFITSNLGDWLDFGHGIEGGPSQWTPQTVSATIVWALGADTIARAALVLNRNSDAEIYGSLYRRIRANFISRLYDPRTKTVKNNGSCQAANAAALCAGLIPEPDRDGALDAIVADLEKRNGQQSTGEVFHVFLIRALGEGGRGDVLHRIYRREEIGSYGYFVNTGLTTLPETWDAKRGTVYGLNHFALGHLVEWHFAYVAGIRQIPGSVGWKKVLIAPQPGDLAEASADFDSPAGRISVHWTVSGGKFNLSAVLPPGVEATAVLPDGSRHALVPGANRLFSGMRTERP